MDKIKKSVEAEKATSQTMYIGPSIRKLGLVSSSVYRGDASTIIEKLKETYPLIGTLFVEIKDITAAKARMDTQGSAEWLAAREILGGEV